MALPTFNELNRPTLEMVASSNDAMHIGEIRAQLIDSFNLSAIDLREPLLSGEEKFYNRVRWVAWYLKKAGLLLSPSRAVFQCTPEGKAFLDHHAGSIDWKTLKVLIEKQQDPSAEAEPHQSKPPTVQDKGTESSDGADATPDELMEQAYNESQAKLVDDLLSRVRNDSYTGFEMLVLDLLRKMGYGEP